MNQRFYYTKLLKGKKSFLSGLSFLSYLGFFLGIFTLLTVSSVMTGLSQNMTKIILGAKSDIHIQKKDFGTISDYKKIKIQIQNIDSSLKISPICSGEFILKNKNYVFPTICRGIIPSEHKNVSNVVSSLAFGSFNDSVFIDNGISIGSGLALSLHASVGDYIKIYTPNVKTKTPFGLIPKMKKVKIISIFFSDMPQYENLFSFISLKNAQNLLGLKDEINLFQIKSNNHYKANKTTKLINKSLPDSLIATSWMIYEKKFYQAMLVEKSIMMTVLFFMILLSIFNLSGNIIMIITEKKIEIGILNSIGASSKWIKQSFLKAIFTLVGFGIFSGTSLALIIILLQQKYKFIPLPISGFSLDYLPMVLNFKDFIWIPLLTLITTLLIIIYPLKQLEKINPINILRD